MRKARRKYWTKKLHNHQNRNLLNQLWRKRKVKQKHYRKRWRLWLRVFSFISLYYWNWTVRASTMFWHFIQIFGSLIIWSNCIPCLNAPINIAIRNELVNILIAYYWRDLITTVQNHNSSCLALVFLPEKLVSLLYILHHCLFVWSLC